MVNGLQYQDIQKRSYMIWESQGRPNGRDLDHWLQAEQELAAEHGKAAPAPTDGAQQEQAPAPRKRRASAKKALTS